MEETSEQEGTTFNIRQTTTEEAEAAVESSGASRTSKYEPIAQAWEESDEAVVVDGLTKNDVQNLRNLIYRRFDKDEVIVRSKQDAEDSFTVAVRERKDGEYLRDEEDETETDTEEVVEDSEEDEEPSNASEDTDTEDTDTDEEDEDEGFSPSFD